MYHGDRAPRSAVVREPADFVPAACSLSVGGRGSGLERTRDRSGGRSRCSTSTASPTRLGVTARFVRRLVDSSSRTAKRHYLVRDQADCDLGLAEVGSLAAKPHGARRGGLASSTPGLPVDRPATVGCGMDLSVDSARRQARGSPSTDSPRPNDARSSASAWAMKKPSTPPVRTTTVTSDVRPAISSDASANPVVAAIDIQLDGGQVKVSTAIRSAMSTFHQRWRETPAIVTFSYSRNRISWG